MAKMSTDTDRESSVLRALFGHRSKVAFAKAYKLPGGASMLSQHLHGHRPVGLEAAVVYARGLGVTIDAFSPRIAALVASAVPYLAEPDAGRMGGVRELPPRGPDWPFGQVTPEQWARLSAEQAALVESMVAQFAPPKQTAALRARA